MNTNYFSISFQQGAFNLSIDSKFSLGKCLGIYGESGSGKSTLLRCLAGLEENVQGSFYFDGDGYLEEGVELVCAEKRSMSLCFQESKLFPHLNVDNNLLFAEKRALDKGARFLEKSEIVEALNLQVLLKKSVLELSGGEKKRVALAQTLLSQARLLFLDEPLSFLDKESQHKFLFLLEALLAKGKITIFYVSHNMQELCRLCEDLIILEAGRITYSGSIQNALTQRSPLVYQSNPFVSLKVSFLHYNEQYGISEFKSENGQVFYVLCPSTLAQAARLQEAHLKITQLKIEANNVSLALVKDHQEPLEEQPMLSMLNQLMGVVESILAENKHSLLLLVDCRGDKILSKISRLSYERMQLNLGCQVRVLVKAASIYEF